MKNRKTQKKAEKAAKLTAEQKEMVLMTARFAAILEQKEQLLAIPASPRIQEAVDRIVKMTGATRPDFIGLSVLPNPGPNATTATDDEFEHSLFVTPEFEEEPDRIIYPVLTHELGHLTLHHAHLNSEAVLERYGERTREQSYEGEFEADEFAKKAGLGDALVKALKEIAARDEMHTGDTPTHPSLKSRIERLERSK